MKKFIISIVLMLAAAVVYADRNPLAYDAETMIDDAVAYSRYYKGTLSREIMLNEMSDSVIAMVAKLDAPVISNRYQMLFIATTPDDCLAAKKAFVIDGGGRIQDDDISDRGYIGVRSVFNYLKQKGVTGNIGEVRTGEPMGRFVGRSLLSRNLLVGQFKNLNGQWVFGCAITFRPINEITVAL